MLEVENGYNLVVTPRFLIFKLKVRFKFIIKVEINTFICFFAHSLLLIKFKKKFTI